MKKRVILILLIFVVGSYITIFQTSFVKAQENIEEKREQADELYQQGGSLFNDKNYTEAKAKFTQAKSIYEEIGDTEKVEICNQFISKTYKGINGDTYFSQAEEKEEAGYFEGAIKDYESAKGFYSEIDQEKYELCKQKIEEIQKTFVIEGLTFPDRNLENAVLQDLRKNFVRKEDLIYVSGLDLSYGYINNIENIGRYFPNLQYLDLSNNNISDISPLLALSDLEELDLSNNDISDISPVSSLINLVELNLSNNDISDISPLIANPNLQTGTKVDISNNPLSSKSVELYIPILEGKGIELTWEPIKKISTTISFLKSKSFIYILVLVAIIISILAIFRITKKKSRKEVKKGKITEERPKEVKIHKEKRVESSELKKLLKERNELKSILNGLKYHKERLIAEKMSEEEYNKLYKQAIEKLKTIEELISLIEEK